MPVVSFLYIDGLSFTHLVSGYHSRTFIKSLLLYQTFRKSANHDFLLESCVFDTHLLLDRYPERL